MAKIDSEELTKKVMRLDPYRCDSVKMKWEILRMISDMSGTKSDCEIFDDCDMRMCETCEYRDFWRKENGNVNR